MKLFYQVLLTVPFIAPSVFLPGAKAQTTPTNPVLYTEFSFGGAWGEAGGLAAIQTLNFQTGRHLVTVRYTGTTRLNASVAHPFIPIPVIEQESSLNELGLLYGWRLVNGGQGYCFSVGVSYSSFSEQWEDANNQPYERTTTYAGVPFEANILWFKSKKAPFKIYGLIPVGRPTGFGGSVGFKLFGSISRNSYAGAGLTYGLGWHKKY